MSDFTGSVSEIMNQIRQRLADNKPLTSADDMKIKEALIKAGVDERIIDDEGELDKFIEQVSFVDANFDQIKNLNAEAFKSRIADKAPVAAQYFLDKVEARSNTKIDGRWEKGSQKDFSKYFSNPNAKWSALGNVGGGSNSFSTTFDLNAGQSTINQDNTATDVVTPSTITHSTTTTNNATSSTQADGEDILNDEWYKQMEKDNAEKGIIIAASDAYEEEMQGKQDKYERDKFLSGTVGKLGGEAILSAAHGGELRMLKDRMNQLQDPTKVQYAPDAAIEASKYMAGVDAAGMGDTAMRNTMQSYEANKYANKAAMAAGSGQMGLYGSMMYNSDPSMAAKFAELSESQRNADRAAFAQAAQLSANDRSGKDQLAFQINNANQKRVDDMRALTQAGIDTQKGELLGSAYRTARYMSQAYPELAAYYRGKAATTPDANIGNIELPRDNMFNDVNNDGTMAGRFVDRMGNIVDRAGNYIGGKINDFRNRNNQPPMDIPQTNTPSWMPFDQRIQDEFNPITPYNNYR